MKRIFSLILILISIPLFAEKHYVATGGGGTGTLASPFATIAQLRAHVLVAGDSVLFNRGDTWVASDDNDRLRLNTYAGTVGDTIYYGAYGSGVKPIITGRASVVGWNTAENWTDRGSNVWSMTSTIIINAFVYNNRGRIWLDGVEVKKNNSTTVATASFPWTHNGQTLYIYSVGNPATTYSNIESIGTVNAVLSISVNYVKIHNLDLRGGANVIYLLAHNIVLDSCNIGYDSGMSGIYTYDSDSVTVRNCSFDSNDYLVDAYSFNNCEDGIKFVDNCTNFEVYGCTFRGWGHTCLGYDQASVLRPFVNIWIHNCTFTGGGVDFSKGFNYNLISNGNNTGNKIYNNYFYNLPVNNQISGDLLEFYNNITDSIKGFSYQLTNSSCGLNITGYSGANTNNLKIFNNIFANCKDYGIYLGYSATYTQQDNLIKNNIFYNNDTDTHYQIYVDNEANTLNNTFQNNLLFKTGQTVLVYNGHDHANYHQTVAEFNASNGLDGDVISGNISGDPTFVSTSDFHLQVGSPAITAGIGVGLTTDYVGNAWAATPSIGAYEYNSSPPTPTDLPICSFSGQVGWYSNLKSISVTIMGGWTDAGGGTITDAGVVISTSANPTTSDRKLSFNEMIAISGYFNEAITGLRPNTTYHMRIFATNESGTAYSADQTLTTSVYNVLMNSGKVLMYNGKVVIIK